MAEIRKVDACIVQKVRIIGTDWVIYRAYEPSEVTGNHSTISFFDHECYGAVRTFFPNEMFPTSVYPVGSQKRIDAVTAFRAVQHDRAYALILAAFPEAVEGKQVDGDIEIYGA